MAITASIGFPRMGPRRELKRMVEQFWQGKIGEEELTARAAELRKLRWQVQKERGVDWMVANDFSFYDHVLDAACLFQAIPERFRGLPAGSLQQYFAMARGTDEATALEMTKWFDTNYHYLVPELEPQQVFALGVNKPLNEYREAKALGFDTVPQLIGPITFLKLSKVVGGNIDPLSLLPNLLPAYQAWLASLREAGAEWVQLDEPALVLDLTDAERQAFVDAYAALSKADRPNILLATYFGSLGDNLATALELPVEGLHLDLVRGPEALQQAHALGWPKGRRLSLGVIDGRNVWRADLDTAFAHLEQGVHLAGAEHVMVAPSCSLLHVPWDVDLETDMDPEIKSWLAFALQKLDEIALLKRALEEGRAAVEAQLEENRALIASRRASSRLNREDVRARLDEVRTWKLDRQSPHAVRKAKQAERFKLPLLPTTTIGSFPQTQAVRDARAKWRKGEWTTDEYEAFLRGEIKRWIDIQEDIGLDVLVHGEFERTDMVEYFGEMLDGFVFTKHGWVQSYGSRCVKPPIIYGDVSRPEPMTVRWSTYAQSLTEKPVKGMLTGPVTILQWSFVRDDIPRDETCRQIALAIRDEVAGSGGGGHRDDPDRRACAARGAASPARRLGGVSRLGRGVLPHCVVGRPGRDADPHAYVLRGIQRHHARHSGDGCGRDLDRDVAIAHGAAEGVRALPLRERHRPGRVRHPQPARSVGGRDGRAFAEGGGRDSSGAALGEPGLRPQDARGTGDRRGASQHGGCGAAHAREPVAAGAVTAFRRGLPPGV